MMAVLNFSIHPSLQRDQFEQLFTFLPTFIAAGEVIWEMPVPSFSTILRKKCIEEGRKVTHITPHQAPSSKTQGCLMLGNRN